MKSNVQGEIEGDTQLRSGRKAISPKEVEGNRGMKNWLVEKSTVE